MCIRICCTYIDLRIVREIISHNAQATAGKTEVITTYLQLSREESESAKAGQRFAFAQA